MGIEELGGVIISQATQRVELAAQNMANMTTAGYKARLYFPNLVDGDAESLVSASTGQRADDAAIDFSVGKLQQTGNPFDLAISGDGFFTVEANGELFYTRSGQFTRDADGHLITPGGAVLQSSSGDVQIDGSDFTVLTDGTIQQSGQPVAQLAIASFEDKRVLKSAGMGLFSAPSAAVTEGGSSQVRQGMLEASNVTTADEMLSMMAGLRSAEAGQRLVQVYDDLMGQVITAFGQQ